MRERENKNIQRLQLFYVLLFECILKSYLHLILIPCDSFLMYNINDQSILGISIPKKNKKKMAQPA